MSYAPDSAVTWIVQHYSATPIEDDWTAADIDRVHKNRGFKGIGYHFFIRKNGMVETGRDLSQPGRFEVGAHSKGENSQSIGICLEGGVTRAAPNVGFDSRTPQQIEAQIALIDSLLERFPGAIVIGHRDMPGAATQCPGYDATAWWDSVVKSRNSIRLPQPAPSIPREVRDLVEECDGAASKTDLFNLLLQWLSGGGAAALVPQIGTLDWRIVVAGMVCLAVVFAVAQYTRMSRGRKASKAMRAKYKLGLADA